MQHNGWHLNQLVGYMEQTVSYVDRVMATMYRLYHAVCVLEM